MRCEKEEKQKKAEIGEMGEKKKEEKEGRGGKYLQVWESTERSASISKYVH